MPDYSRNLNEVRQRIERACAECGRSPDEITLIAVSKTHDTDAIRAVSELGVTHFGENKVQELTPKMEELDQDGGKYGEINWHMVGTLQTNKIKYLAERVNWIDSVPKLKSLKEINKRAGKAGRVINTLIQVNISDEDQKSGCEPADLPALLKASDEMEFVRVMGLMGIASFVKDPETIRPQFRMLRALLEQEQQKGYKTHRLQHLSMGMTHDMEVAIQEGATMIRVGTAIFGERDYA